MKPDNHRPKPQRRVYPDELKKEAVQMLLDGHSAPSVRATSASATPPCCTAGRPKPSVSRARLPPPWRPGCGTSRSNCAAPSGGRHT